MFRRAIEKIKRPQVVQAMADGAANTVGTVVVYTIIVLLVFLWYHWNKTKKAAAAPSNDGGGNFLYNALNYSKPAVALGKMKYVLSAQDPSPVLTHAKDQWV